MILFSYFLLINISSFILLGYDKRLAIKNQRRISEKTLLTFTFIGGTIGSGIAMRVFKHKTSKESYLLKFYGIITIQILVLYGLFYFEIIQF